MAVNKRKRTGPLRLTPAPTYKTRPHVLMKRAYVKIEGKWGEMGEKHGRQ